MAALLNPEALPLVSAPLRRSRPARVGGRRASAPLRLTSSGASTLARPSYDGFDPFVEVGPAPLRLVPQPTRRQLRRRHRSAIATGFATVAALIGLWFGAGALRSAEPTHLGVVPGSVRTAHGYLYRVRPGDTLWSITTELDPTGDPRPLVAELAGQLHGGTLLVGEQLRLP